jgi:glutamate formiminotransferase/formiminotetrahydrofolate cyclodeaminase
MDAFSLPKNTDDEKTARSNAIQEATLYATEIPFITMQKSYACFELCEAMVQEGNPNSVSDAGVGALCARTAVYGAYLNVKINASGLKDKTTAEKYIQEATSLLQKANEKETSILALVETKL